MNSGKQYTNVFDAYRIGKDLEEKLCYTIGKALHMWLLDNWDLSFEQRKLLNKFIATYYPEKKQ